MYKTDNPIADFERMDAELASERRRLPVCDDCGEPIEGEYTFLINDSYICIDCLHRNYRKHTDDLMDW